MDDIQSFCKTLVNNLEKVIIGKRESVEFISIGLLSQGHVLIEDVPGVGKTVLARSLAKSLGCSFNRLQFTPDMLPSDVTGVSIFDQTRGVSPSPRDTGSQSFGNPNVCAYFQIPGCDLSTWARLRIG